MEKDKQTNSAAVDCLTSERLKVDVYRFEREGILWV